MSKYTETMDGIKAPQEAVDRAVKAALEADKNRKVIKLDSMTNEQQMNTPVKTGKKHTLIRVISAVAACAVLTAAGIMTRNGKGGTVHSGFSLTANAAELKKGSSVEILSVQGHEPAGRFSMDGDGRNGYALMEEYLTFSVNCTGEDIQKVNYRVKNGVFCLGSWQTVLEEGSEVCEKYVFSSAGDTARTVPASKENMNRPGEDLRVFDTGSVLELSANNLYTAFTVPFDRQNMISPEIQAELDKLPSGEELVDPRVGYPSCIICTCLSSSDKELDSRVKDTMMKYNKNMMDESTIKTAYADYVMDAYDRAEQNGESEPSDLLTYEEFWAQNYSSVPVYDKDKDFKLFYDELINDISVEVTVTYNDGTTETSTMQLSCEKVENGIVTIGAKLV